MPLKPLNPNRLSWIDYNRGISIILICYLHLSYLLMRYYGINPDAYWILKYSNIFFYGFRMPLFFMISGILLQQMLAKKGFYGYVKNRFNTIFYPLLVWGFIRITLQMAVGHLSPKHGSAVLYIYLLTDPRKIAPFWYLHALFCVSVLYIFVRVKLKVLPRYNFIIGALLYLLSAYTISSNLEIGFIADILKYYVFFAIGDLLSDIILSDETKNFLFSKKLFLILLVPFLLVQGIVMKYNDAHRNILYVENSIPLLYLLQGLVGCGFSVAFSFLLQKWNVLPWLKTIGFHSLYIYCMHYIVIIVCCVLCIKVMHLHNTLLLVGVCWSAAAIVPILVYKLSRRFNWWWLFSLSKPKKHHDELYLEENKKSPPIATGEPFSV